jgi:hypothetical protein
VNLFREAEEREREGGKSLNLCSSPIVPYL